MLSWAPFCVVLLGQSFVVSAQLWDAAKLMVKSVEFEKDIMDLCQNAAPVSVEIGGEAELVDACAIASGAVAAVALTGALLDVADWAGCSLLDWARGLPHHVKTRNGRIPAILRKEIQFQQGLMNNDFTQMQQNMQNLAHAINDRAWPDVAAYATMILADGKGFVEHTRQAFIRANCLAPMATSDCKHDYYVCQGAGCTSNGCNQEPSFCWEDCCNDQEPYCNGDEQCMYDRGCGPHDAPVDPMLTLCHVLEDTKVEMEVALTEVKGLHDCAVELKTGKVLSKGCSEGAERQLSGQVRRHLQIVARDLKHLSELDQNAGGTVAASAALVESVIPEHFGAVCGKLKQRVPPCVLTGEPRVTPEPETFCVPRTVWLALDAVLASLLLASVQLSKTAGAAPAGDGGRVAMEAAPACDGGPVAMAAAPAGDEGRAHLLPKAVPPAAPAGGGSACLVASLKCCSIIVALLALAAVAITWPRGWACEHGGPSSQRASPSPEQCLARAHNVEQAYDMCLGVSRVLGVASDRDESAEVALGKVVSQLANGFPELADVMLGSSSP